MEKITRKKGYGKDLRNLNRTGDRIRWCRTQLGLKQSEVCNHTGIPRSTYQARENGVRSTFIEEILVLADFFNSRWGKKFGANYPEFEKNKISHIVTSWILFGVYR